MVVEDGVAIETIIIGELGISDLSTDVELYCIMRRRRGVVSLNRARRRLTLSRVRASWMDALFCTTERS